MNKCIYLIVQLVILQILKNEEVFVILILEVNT